MIGIILPVIEVFPNYIYGITISFTNNILMFTRLIEYKSFCKVLSEAIYLYRTISFSAKSLFGIDVYPFNVINSIDCNTNGHFIA